MFYSYPWDPECWLVVSGNKVVYWPVHTISSFNQNTVCFDDIVCY